MIDPRAFLGKPITIGSLCKIYPPTINDIITNELALYYFRLLTQSQEDIEDIYYETNNTLPSEEDHLPTPFEILFISINKKPDFMQILTDALEFFLREPVQIMSNNGIILIGTEEEIVSCTDLTSLRIINSENFLDIQNGIREAMGKDKFIPPKQEENIMIRKIKAAGRKRERLKRKNSKGTSLTLTLAAICCMGIGITPLNIGEISYSAIDTILALYQQKEKYDIDIRSLMAGADPKKVKPKYWISEQSDYQQFTI